MDTDRDSGIPLAPVTAVLNTTDRHSRSDSSVLRVRESQLPQGAALLFSQVLCGPCSFH